MNKNKNQKGLSTWKCKNLLLHKSWVQREVETETQEFIPRHPGNHRCGLRRDPSGVLTRAGAKGVSAIGSLSPLVLPDELRPGHIHPFPTLPVYGPADQTTPSWGRSSRVLVMRWPHSLGATGKPGSFSNWEDFSPEGNVTLCSSSRFLGYDFPIWGSRNPIDHPPTHHLFRRVIKPKWKGSCTETWSCFRFALVVVLGHTQNWHSHVSPAMSPR